MSYVDGWDADTPAGLEQQYRTLAAARIYMKRRTKNADYSDPFVRGYVQACGDLDHIIYELWNTLYRTDKTRAIALREEHKDEKGNWKT